MIKKLNDICSFVSGNAWKAAEFADEGIPIIRINNMNTNDADFVYWQGDYDKKYIINKGDLLVSLSGTIKTFRWDGPEALLNQRIVKVVAHPDTNQDWVYYQIFHVIEQIANKGKHAVIKNVSVNDLKNFEVDVPDFQTQNKIVAILDKARLLVQKRQKTIDLLDELLKSQFFEMFGDFNKFDRVPFKNFLSKPLRNGISPSSNGKIEFDVLVLSAITGGWFDNTKIKKGVFQQLPDDSKIVNSSDFLVCRGNGNLNMVGMGEFAEDINHAVFPDTMIGATIDTQKIRKLFLTILWKTQFIRNQIKKASRTTNGTHKINQSGLENIELIVPPIDLQNKFEQIGESINRLLTTDSSLTESKKDLDNFLSSLIQRAFGGKLKFDVSIELDALLEEIDLQKQENDLYSILSNEEYVNSLVERLNTQGFENQDLYDKAKHAAFQLLKTNEILAQKYDEDTKSLKLVVK